MPNWIKKIFGIRPTFGKHTPIIPSKFPRLKALDRRVAASRSIVEPSLSAKDNDDD
jgi:hypothetical protein